MESVFAVTRASQFPHPTVSLSPLKLSSAAAADQLPFQFTITCLKLGHSYFCEVTKVPSKSSQHLDELEIAKELDKLSTKLDDVDEMISSALASDPQVKTLLRGTADLWMPVITASADERRTFSASIADDNPETKEESLTWFLSCEKKKKNRGYGFYSFCSFK